MIENSIFDEMMLSMKLKSGSAMFISENIILDYNCGFDGDVKAHLKKLCRRFLIPFIILFNLVPVTLYFAFFDGESSLNLVLLSMVIVYHTWVVTTFYYFMKYGDGSQTWDYIILMFPTNTPMVIFINVAVYFLKKRYVNSYDPEEIKKFNRRKKIKSIL